MAVNDVLFSVSIEDRHRADPLAVNDVLFSVFIDDRLCADLLAVNDVLFSVFTCSLPQSCCLERLAVQISIVSRFPVKTVSAVSSWTDGRTK